MGEGICGYDNRDWGDDGYAMECELPHGHDGDHRLTITWATRLDDICRANGHVYGEWQPYTETKPNLFVFIREWKVEPTAWRRCERCKALDFEGGERNQDISNALFAALYVQPAVVPAMPPMAKVKFEEFKV